MASENPVLNRPVKKQYSKMQPARQDPD